MKKIKKFMMHDVSRMAFLFVLAFVAVALDATLTGGLSSVTMAVTICGQISANLGPNCDKPLQGGTQDRMVVINWDTWQDTVTTTSGTNDQVVESITLPSGETGYLYQGKNNSTLPSHTYKKQRFAEVFDHMVNFKVFGIGPDEKKQLNAMVQGRFVVILENKYKGEDGETAFEIYGADAGMVVPDGGVSRDPASAETQGAYDVTFSTDEFDKEPKLPKQLFITDYATTKAVFEGLFTE